MVLVFNELLCLEDRSRSLQGPELTLDTYLTKTYYGPMGRPAFGHCLMVGRQILVLKVGVRLPVPEPY